MCTKEYDQHWVALLVNISIGCDFVTVLQNVAFNFQLLVATGQDTDVCDSVYAS